MRFFLAAIATASLAVSVQGFNVRSARTAMPVRSQLVMQQQAQPQDAGKELESMFNALKKSFIPIALGAGLFLSLPNNADAAQSGGRSGGSSFRSGSTRLQGSTGYAPAPTTQINIMPSPFGFFSPFGMPFFSPFSFFPIFNLQTILFLGAAYAVYTVISNATGGSNFSNMNEEGSLGSGATILKIQLALDADWNDQNNIMNTLSMLAQRNSMIDGRDDLSRLLGDASMALLRKSGDWNGAAYQTDYFRQPEKAEPSFQNLAITERTKFEEETSSIALPRASGSAGSQPTQVVVSILCAIRGKSSAILSNGRINSEADARKVLQGLAADAATDEGDNVMAVEVLWTPSESSNILTPRDIIDDYPELLRF